MGLDLLQVIGPLPAGGQTGHLLRAIQCLRARHQLRRYRQAGLDSQHAIEFLLCGAICLPAAEFAHSVLVIVCDRDPRVQSWRSGWMGTSTLREELQWRSGAALSQRQTRFRADAE